ncbi:MAG: hypothetical protein HY744_08595 [Deltaproteobacteria bacterium]|nr:hypothetical protein [Deltaproteobacteria bacterium]
MLQRVYLDTTIPSYAVELVRAELARGAFPARAEALALVAPLPDLPLSPEVVQVAQYFRENVLVPSYDIGDSLHLALATVHRVAALATWNHRHLANPRKRRHLAVLCGRLGLPAPDIASPEELLEEE